MDRRSAIVFGPFAATILSVNLVGQNQILIGASRRQELARASTRTPWGDPDLQGVYN
jgi:hypothetical protein